MRFISTRTHGIMDYAVGVILILAPFVLGFATGGAAMWVPIVVGIAILGQAMMTRYELGVVKTMPMPMHLGVDVAAGAILLVSPWLFGFADVIWWPHVIVGLLVLGSGLMTEKVPEWDKVAVRT